jgi:hypothetical protein
MKTYTVIGIYKNTTNQRWAESFKAKDVDHAEEHAQDSAESSGGKLIIAGVILGNVKLVG